MRKCSQCGEDRYLFAMDSDGVVTSVPHHCKGLTETDIATSANSILQGPSIVPANKPSVYKKPKRTRNTDVTDASFHFAATLSCPVCYVKIPAEKLAHHVQACRTQRELAIRQKQAKRKQAKQNEAVAHRNPTKSYYQCPNCGVSVLTKRQTTHENKCPKTQRIYTDNPDSNRTIPRRSSGQVYGTDNTRNEITVHGLSTTNDLGSAIKMLQDHFRGEGVQSPIDSTQDATTKRAAKEKNAPISPDPAHQPYVLQDDIIRQQKQDGLMRTSSTRSYLEPMSTGRRGEFVPSTYRLIRHNFTKPSEISVSTAHIDQTDTRAPLVKDAKLSSQRNRKRAGRIVPTSNQYSKEQMGYADPRDASKGWGNMAREHGRFGSYPVHDNFGDEAEP